MTAEQVRDVETWAALCESAMASERYWFLLGDWSQAAVAAERAEVYSRRAFDVLAGSAGVERAVASAGGGHVLR